VARKALKNTFGYENVGGVEVRRLVRAGRLIPDAYRVEEGEYEHVAGVEGPIARPASVPAHEAATVQGKDPQVKDPHDLTVDQLKEELDSRGVDYKSDAKKADLIRLYNS